MPLLLSPRPPMPPRPPSAAPSSTGCTSPARHPPRHCTSASSPGGRWTRSWRWRSHLTGRSTTSTSSTIKLTFHGRQCIASLSSPPTLYRPGSGSGPEPHPRPWREREQHDDGLRQCGDMLGDQLAQRHFSPSASSSPRRPSPHPLVLHVRKLGSQAVTSQLEPPIKPSQVWFLAHFLNEPTGAAVKTELRQA